MAHKLIPEDQPLSAEELDKLWLLHKHLNKRILATGLRFGDLIRFVRGFAQEEEKSPEATLQRLTTCIEWREKEDIAGLVHRKLPIEQRFYDMWPAGHHGFDKAGHPVYLEKLGAADTAVILKEFDTEDVLRLHVQMMEAIARIKERLRLEYAAAAGSRQQPVPNAPAAQEAEAAAAAVPPAAQEAGAVPVAAAVPPPAAVPPAAVASAAADQPPRAKVIYKHTVVLDLKGVGMAHVTGKFKALVQKTLSVDQFMMPESLYKMVLVNVPWLFRAVWAIVSGWLDPVTRDKIQMGEKHLTEWIDPESIPKYLGGKCECDNCFRGIPDEPIPGPEHPRWQPPEWIAYVAAKAAQGEFLPSLDDEGNTSEEGKTADAAGVSQVAAVAEVDAAEAGSAAPVDVAVEGEGEAAPAADDVPVEASAAAPVEASASAPVEPVVPVAATEGVEPVV